MSRKERHLENLSRAGFSLWIDDDLRYVIIENVRLPLGYNYRSIPVLIELPSDYPLTPPGVGSDCIYVPEDLRYRKHKLRDIHEGLSPHFETPGFSGWAWMCYEHIDWDSCRDDLITLIETIRTDLTNPPLD